MQEDTAEKALELACRWLHGHKMALDEKVATNGLNAGISLRSPEGRTESDDEDFPAWDWAGKLVSKEEAVLTVVEWLFSESGDACGDGPLCSHRGGFARRVAREA